MGNCQAVDAAALVVQHPSGKLERMYWPITASEVMKANPGHYVSLIIPLPLSGDHDDHSGGGDNNKTIRFTRVKLLRPTDILVLGRAYRLVTTQEVMKVLRAKKHAKMKKNLSESAHDLQTDSRKQSVSSESENNQCHNIRPTSTGARIDKFSRRKAKIVAAVFAKHNGAGWKLMVACFISIEEINHKC
ncbi:hypothetical protein CASFOL_003797 [Castilleja foliolosa]|uniref:Uncharacterized protein n=1 Tax=Castilleja foliolosa TaxID=1961234 RepID=A0ABD3ELG3_9LAMI